ncbi:TetR/AcrR family transcriptional regulator [Mycobacterium sp. TNTM28]|uniref:TetR/AcrR family transcriptional regulator n=1 Tax=[Mycobacterium] fortunisiensis TaxID=2600579 RepID=A0ABS6KIN6_9MYCO|nr:TetR/AcrR family transcriptional regulator [[Mycobacterium] fortunisiensis]MBU9763420.1 TetR/AcrR family transcriptional regulator [[Mycobacterium] fortunisiensis]
MGSSTAVGGDGRAATENDSRLRILVATAEVLERRGVTKLSMSEVAVQAGISRMTLYRFFPSKEHLINEYTNWETDRLEAGLAMATAGLRGVDRVDATLKFLVDYQTSYSGLRMIDIEPGHVIARMSALMPTLKSRLAAILSGDDAELAAGAVMRIIVSHYVVSGDDADEFLAQLRHAAGLRPSDAPVRRSGRVSRPRSS